MGHGDLQTRCIVSGRRFPARRKPNLYHYKIEGACGGATGVVSCPDPDNPKQSQFYTYDAEIFDEQRNYLRRIKWEADSRNPLKETGQHKDFLGFITVLEEETATGTEYKIIGANAKTGRIVELSPELNKDPRGPLRKYTQRVEDYFEGIPTGMNFVPGPNPLILVVAGGGRREGTVIYIYDYNDFSLIKRQPMGARMSARIAVDPQGKIYFSVEAPTIDPDASPHKPALDTSFPDLNADGELIRMVYDPLKREFVLDQGAGQAVFRYEAVSGTTPTIMGDRVVFMSNAWPQTAAGRPDMTVYSLKKDDFSLDHMRMSSPFERRSDSNGPIGPSAHGQCTLNGYLYPKDQLPDECGDGESERHPVGYLIAHSWAGETGDPDGALGPMDDNTIGTVRLDLFCDGSLSEEAVWRDRIAGWKRFGCLAPESEILVYSYHREGKQVVRAVKTYHPLTDEDMEQEDPRCWWEVPIDLTRRMDTVERSRYMGIVSPGDDSYFVVTNLDGVYVLA